MPDKRLIALIY